ncbi:YheC/YheD family protein [Bacillus sp. B15-48]|uniref:YheC/YheD family endospore coat-associated protein n=1 Tax=Bacillus sp. B15-48 TaxID=1548601 RepID=UPI00193F9AFC|nr:YheC/YheD family protein [Bacillus sp. B15-48]MBM4764105.1 hypothetical protein [Bacillus sp. B15-48]
MKLFYDSWQELWFQNDSTERLSFGANKVPLPHADGKAVFSVDINTKHDNVGPLIGIMASLSTKGTVVGNAPLFKALQREALANGGVTFVFPPEGINNGRVSGFMFLPEKNAWYSVVTPLPHAVYNRVPLRKTEDSPAFNQAGELFTEWRIPFFNPSFIDKSELYQLFSSRPFLKSLMPETINVSEKQELADFLTKHEGIYLKPALSSRGSGIFSLRKEENGSIHFKSHTKKRIYPAFSHFWEENSSELLSRHYIAQVEIIPDLLEGNRYDFRIHGHDSGKGYQITGIGVRQSQKQSLTTHIPNGGRLIPYERVQTKQHDDFFAKLVTEVGELLTKEMGYFGEFSLDAGVTKSGDYVLYEVNSKPMEFNEVEIEKRRVKKIIELLFRKADFKAE